MKKEQQSQWPNSNQLFCVPWGRRRVIIELMSRALGQVLLIVEGNEWMLVPLDEIKLKRIGSFPRLFPISTALNVI